MWGSPPVAECRHMVLGADSRTIFPSLNVARQNTGSVVVNGRLWITGGAGTYVGRYTYRYIYGGYMKALQIRSVYK